MRRLSAIQWADLAAFRFARFGPVGKLSDPQQWQIWAIDLCDLPALRRQSPPNPQDFALFEDWARSFDTVITIGD